MQNKIADYLVFIVYSWLIYNTYVFMLAPMYILEAGLIVAICYVLGVISVYFYVPLIWLVLHVLVDPFFYESLFSVNGIVPLLIILIYLIVIFFWWRRQTIIRA